MNLSFYGSEKAVALAHALRECNRALGPNVSIRQMRSSGGNNWDIVVGKPGSLEFSIQSNGRYSVEGDYEYVELHYGEVERLADILEEASDPFTGSQTIRIEIESDKIHLSIEGFGTRDLWRGKEPAGALEEGVLIEARVS